MVKFDQNPSGQPDISAVSYMPRWYIADLEKDCQPSIIKVSSTDYDVYVQQHQYPMVIKQRKLLGAFVDHFFERGWLTAFWNTVYKCDQCNAPDSLTSVGCIGRATHLPIYNSLPTDPPQDELTLAWHSCILKSG